MPTTVDSPLGAHVNFPELTWPPAHSDLLPSLQPDDETSATDAPPPVRPKRFGSLIFLAAMAAGFLAWLSQAKLW